MNVKAQIDPEMLKFELKIINKLFDYIKKHSDECMMDVLTGFCSENNVSFDEVGYLIAEDPYLKEFINSNLKKFNYLKSEVKNFDCVDSDF